MAGVIGQVLPEAIGIALSPFPIIGLILILFTKQARTNSLMFMIGWLLGLTVVAFVIEALVSAGKIAVGADSAEAGIKWGAVILGAALIVMAFRTWKQRPKAGQQAETPKWMATLDSVKPGAAFGLGAVLSGVNPKNLLLNVAAAAAIAGANLDTTSTIIVTIIFVLISSVTIIGPVVYVQVAGKSAEATLNTMKTWLIQNNSTIMAVLLLLIGAKILGNGLDILG